MAHRLAAEDPMPRLSIAHGDAVATAAQPTGGRRRRLLTRFTSHVVAVTPRGLPTTYPTRMPSVIRDVNAWRRKVAETGMPALAQ